MKRVPLAFLIAALLIVGGCVLRTEHKIEAHITLDIRHIEEQAEATLDYIEGKTDTVPDLELPAAAAPTSWLRNTLDALAPVQVAYAAELKAESPLVKQILDSLRARHAQVDAMKKQGCFGENNRGYVELRECDALKETDKKNEAQKLLSEENKDRKALYNEIARLNKEEGVSVSMVESIYAMERLQRAATGEAV
ncbi:MAG: DUF1318 domain-containing protein, partial [Candidatus Hydrogenedentes bacterium]|nr:DUF1318 domain-containing protein [Candidatus Hydrogenedentota bacterium]